MTFAKGVATATLILTVAACGGAETGPIQFGAVASVDEDFEALIGLGEAYDAQFPGSEADDNRLSTAAELPAAGTANFSGVMLITPPRLAASTLDPFLAMGETSIVVDFDAKEATGTTGQFFQIDPSSGPSLSQLSGTRIDGSVDYALTDRSLAGNLYLGDATGELTDTDGGTQTIDVTIGGGLMGPDASGFRAVTLSDVQRQVQVYGLED